jgi:hypothetical protein
VWSCDQSFSKWETDITFSILWVKLFPIRIQGYGSNSTRRKGRCGMCDCSRKTKWKGRESTWKREELKRRNNQKEIDDVRSVLLISPPSTELNTRQTSHFLWTWHCHVTIETRLYFLSVIYSNLRHPTCRARSAQPIGWLASSHQLELGRYMGWGDTTLLKFERICWCNFSEHTAMAEEP